MQILGALQRYERSHLHLESSTFMPNHTNMHDVDGTMSLTFACGELPADAGITASGHEPNGYFWEGIVQYLWPDLAEQLEMDSEAGMFVGYGDRTVLEQLQGLISPYLDDGERVSVAVREAERSGFQFDD